MHLESKVSVYKGAEMTLIMHKQIAKLSEHEKMIQARSGREYPAA